MDHRKVSILSPCFRSEKYLEPFLENVTQQTILPHIELVLDHNEPTPKELIIVDKYKKQYPHLIIHNIVRPVVPVSASINRCINTASGKYLCIGNADDLRTPDSIELMCRTLDNYAEIGFTYGDFTVVNEFSRREGPLVVTMEFNRIEFIRGMHVGPFFMWRSSLTPIVGYWDEQFLSGGDFDFAVRLALISNGKKTPGNLGYYLNMGQGASSGGTHVPREIQPIERTVIEFRYGQYDKTILLNGFRYVSRAKKYRLDKMLVSGEWHPITDYLPDYRERLREREHEQSIFRKAYWHWLIMQYTIHLPNVITKNAREGVKSILQKMGMLNAARSLRTRVSSMIPKHVR